MLATPAVADRRRKKGVPHNLYHTLSQSPTAIQSFLVDLTSIAQVDLKNANVDQAGPQKRPCGPKHAMAKWTLKALRGTLYAAKWTPKRIQVDQTNRTVRP